MVGGREDVEGEAARKKGRRSCGHDVKRKKKMNKK